MNAFKITTFSADEGVLAKTFGVENGKVTPQRPGLIAIGSYHTWTTNLAELASYLKTTLKTRGYIMKLLYIQLHSNIKSQPGQRRGQASPVLTASTCLTASSNIIATKISPRAQQLILQEDSL